MIKHANVGRDPLRDSSTLDGGGTILDGHTEWIFAGTFWNLSQQSSLMAEQNAPGSTNSPTFSGRLGSFLVVRRLVFFPLGLVLFAAAWPISQRLEFDRSIESLYAEGDPYLQEYLESKSLFGGDELAMVAYTDPELFEPGTETLSRPAKQRLKVLANRLSEIEGVQKKSTQDLATNTEAKVRIFGIPISVPRDVLYFLARDSVGK